MSATSGTQEHEARRVSSSASLLKSLAGFLLVPALAIALVMGAAAAGLIYFEQSYEGRIYPGVTAWGVDLEGMTPEEARDALVDAFPYPDQTAFTFRDPGTGQTWSATPAELGVTFDVESTIAQAHQVGRGDTLGNNLTQQLDIYLNGRHLSPVLVRDSNAAIAFLEAIALEIYLPVMDAGLVLAESQLIATPSQVGRQMNMADAHERLSAPLGALGGAEIELIVDETLPEINDQDVIGTLAEAERLVGQPITVFLAEQSYEEDAQIEPLVFTRQALVSALLLELDRTTTPPHYTVRLDRDMLTAQLEPLAPLLETEPANARFIFNDDTRLLEVLQNSVPARRLNISATVDQIIAQATTDSRELPLVIEWVKPLVSEDATAESLGITELVAEGQTFFPGSSEVRVHNIAIAASRFHGIVIAPGDTFSFNEYLGDVSEETGFENGLIIFGGRTIEGVGGGVCQVSTTAFQAAFYAGFPVQERYPHGYRVSYYEHGEGPGMDATVFYPVVDLKFVNDTPYHLLIETYTNERAQRLTFRFYSTSDGRTVEKVSTDIWDVIPHPPDLYEEDLELALGEIKQVDWSADGANVLVKRVIRAADGRIIREDQFFSRYLPWQAIYHYGPGTENIPTPEPTPEPTETPTP